MTPMHLHRADANDSADHRPQYQPLVIVLMAAAGGVVADRFWPRPLGVWLALAIGCVALWWVIGVLIRRCPPWSAIARNVVLLGTVASVAAAWHHGRWCLFAADDLGRYATRRPEPVCVEAVALAAPRALPARAHDPMQGRPLGEAARFDVEVTALRNGAAWQPVSGRARVMVYGELPTVAAGDRLRIFGRLSAPRGRRNPGGWDYAAYLRADRVGSCLRVTTPECVTVVERGSGWSIARLLARVRAHSRKVLDRYLDPRQAELAAAVLLGLREEVDNQRNEAFMATGTIHILAISGLHIGILAWALFWLLRRTPLPQSMAVAAVAAIILFYVLMVDAKLPAVRAMIIVLVACAAVWLGRRVLSYNSLAAAGLVVLALNPEHLFHVGAQLSFLCVAGLIWVARRRPDVSDKDPADRMIEHLIEVNLSWRTRVVRELGRAVRGIFVAGVVLWALTLPLIAARFHVVSLAALGLNLVLWPCMTLSVLGGFGVVVFDAVFPPLAYLCGMLCNLSFWALEAGVRWAQQTPGSHFWASGPGDWWLWGFYGGLGSLLAFPRLRPSRRGCVVLLVGWIGVGFAAAYWPKDHDRLDCTFLSVGHGAAILVEFPSGQTVLYDAGQMGLPTTGDRIISRMLWSRGIRRLDAVVISHPDIDHYNALPGLLKKFSVGAVYVTPAMFQSHARTVGVLQDTIRRYGVPIRELTAGDRLPVGDGATARVLYPSRGWTAESDNANSLVLAIEYQGHRILLTGDLESPGLERLLSREPLRCEVLLAPHHGSTKSNSAALAAWCRPRFVVISGDGRRNRPDGKSPYRAVGARVFDTYECGAVGARITADGVEIGTFAESPPSFWRN